MKLKNIKVWLNSLPDEFDEFNCVNGEEGIIDEQYHYRIDKPIISCYIDEETKEVVFCHQEIKIDNGNEQSN